MKKNACTIMMLIFAFLMTVSGCISNTPTTDTTTMAAITSVAATTKEPTKTDVLNTSMLEAVVTSTPSKTTAITSAAATSTAPIETTAPTFATTTITKPTTVATTKAIGTTAETTEQPAGWEGPIPMDPTDSPAPTNPRPGTYSADMAQQVLVLVNQARADAGNSALTWNDTLASSCDIRAKEIVTYFSHTRPDETSYTTASNGLAHGENIACGNCLSTAQDVMNAWMASEGHKNNLLGVYYDYTITAISCYCVHGAYYDMYYWVEEFG